jgi:hypothetical protein
MSVQQRPDFVVPIMHSFDEESVNYLSLSTKQSGRSQPTTVFVLSVCVFALVAQLTTVRVPYARAASDLRLAPNLSFNDDSGPNFPIRGRNLAEGLGRTGEATLILFGTSNCWNTAREAERLVKLYPQFRNRLHFVIVDLRSVAPAQQPLVSHYYHGYIPTVTAISSDGNVIYNRAGETATVRGDTSNLHRLLDSLY